MASEFFQIMLDHHIIYPRAELYWDKFGKIEGVHCRLRPGAPSHQLAYTTLTCYRWINTSPGLVWETLALNRMNLGISIYPILVHVVAKHIANQNHSFLTSAPSNNAYYSSAAAVNPLLGVAAKRYFDPKLARPEPKHTGSIHYVNQVIQDLARKLTPEETVGPDPNRWSPAVSRSKYQLDNPLDGLHPRYLPLYEEAELTQARAEELLAEISQQKGSTCPNSPLVASAS
jgi:hypothetical protein